MMRLSSLAPFLAIAAGVHALGFAALARNLSGGGGDSGTHAVSIEAVSSASVAGLIETWETAPNAASDVASPGAPDTDQIARLPDVETLPQSLVPAALSTTIRPDNVARATLPEAMASVATARPDLPRLPNTEDRQTSQDPPSQIAPTHLADTSFSTASTPPPPPQRFAPAASLRPEARASRDAPPQPPTLKQTASGKGKTADRGTGTSRRSGPSSAQITRAKAAWQTAIQRRLERYKTSVRGSGRGRAQVTLTIHQSGQLTNVALSRSSGISSIDRAALNSARRAAPFPAAPAGLSAKTHRFSVWVRFDS